MADEQRENDPGIGQQSCPFCGAGLRGLDESQWPAEGPVPEGTLAVYLCEGQHRVIVAPPAVQG
ncbi:hypothetical protein [Arthrobacter crystallopoietes]|uniref:Uncharacterized protein n=1 Tax=Crystallibacter crystallopoietes TaxID=37928 RepID=A0A1H1E247_9MICC|nr:hypothetical protein [Arthrobacter crystallopoietes]AUI50076.1 hypothetical protein AC20117_03835 [Arthrobacter crystallopoietes]SDQ82680.1 hypothetical protein SAMN04489742_2722 [Arthrobacter crystallopoietes]